MAVTLKSNRATSFVTFQFMMRAALRPVAAHCSRRYFSNTRCLQNDIVNLAFTRHDPPKTASPSYAASPIILLHGLFGSQRNNRTFSKYDCPTSIRREHTETGLSNVLHTYRVLAQKLSRPVYTVDLRNHGVSPHHSTHTYVAMSEDVEHLLRTDPEFTNIPSSSSLKMKPIIIGHSMGAKVVMTLALRSPSSYSGIVPVDNAPVDAALKSDFGTYVKAMMEVEAAKVTKQSDADKILEKYEKDLGIRQFLLTNLMKNPDDPKGPMKFRIPLNTLAKNLDRMADFPFADPDAARYEGPVLVIRGGESRYVADEALPVMGRFFPRFELVDVKGAGHWVISERFDECVGAVVEWVGRCIDGDGEEKH